MKPYVFCSVPPGLPVLRPVPRCPGAGRALNSGTAPMTHLLSWQSHSFLPVIGWGQSLSWFWPMRNEERRSSFSRNKKCDPWR